MRDHTATVEFSRSGLRQLIKMNRVLGNRFVRGIILRHSVATYIAAHEEHGKAFDTICQELHYGDGIYLLLTRTNGTWVITDIWYSGEPAAYEPVYLWHRVRRGFHTLTARLLACWRDIVTAPPIPEGSNG